jgi:hemin uptake protein HemP
MQPPDIRRKKILLVRIVLIYTENRSHYVTHSMRSILARTEALKAINQAEAKLAGKLIDQLPLDSHALFAGNSKVVITHGAEIFRLGLMIKNRLILTK